MLLDPLVQNRIEDRAPYNKYNRVCTFSVCNGNIKDEDRNGKSGIRAATTAPTIVF
jgi:hypothetical protein